MNGKNILKIAGLGLIFCNYLLLVSCQKTETFIGYNDVILNSPTLLWGSSIKVLKNTFPNVVNESGDNITFDEYDFNGKNTIRFFDFVNNQLWRVGVSYGQYNHDELDLLRKGLQEKYGIFPIEDNGTIEAWYLELNEDNEIVFLINKIENNTVNCSYINPPLRDEYDKTIIWK